MADSSEKYIKEILSSLPSSKNAEQIVLTAPALWQPFFCKEDSVAHLEAREEILESGSLGNFYALYTLLTWPTPQLWGRRETISTLVSRETACPVGVLTGKGRDWQETGKGCSWRASIPTPPQSQVLMLLPGMDTVLQPEGEPVPGLQLAGQLAQGPWKSKLSKKQTDRS